MRICLCLKRMLNNAADTGANGSNDNVLVNNSERYWLAVPSNYRENIGNTIVEMKMNTGVI